MLGSDEDKEEIKRFSLVRKRLKRPNSEKRPMIEGIKCRTVKKKLNIRARIDLRDFWTNPFISREAEVPRAMT